MLTKFLSPKNDVAFKRIFGTERNKDILLHFLNDMVVLEGQPAIEDVTFLKTAQDPETAAQKVSIVDILCKDKNGVQYIVEMQVARDKTFIERAQFYAAKAYIQQMEAGKSFENIKEVIFVAITDFTMFPDDLAYKTDHATLNIRTHKRYLNAFSFTFLELPKFNVALENLSSLVEKWMYFFKHAEIASESEVARAASDTPIIERAYEELNRFAWDDVELRTYDQSEKQRLTYEGVMTYQFEQGLLKGEQRGLEKGREEGAQQAMEKTARNLLSAGLSVEDIAQATGLPVTVVQELRGNSRNS